MDLMHSSMGPTSRACISILTALFAIQIVLTDSAMQRGTAMRVAESDTQGKPKYRELKASAVMLDASTRKHIVMSNCTRAVTLTDACKNESNANDRTPLLCVGSSATHSCPRGAAVVQPVPDSTSLYRADASGLGIEKALLHTVAKQLWSLDLHDNKLQALDLDASLTDLRTLQVAMNRFQSFRAISVPFGVTDLNVSHNPLKHIELGNPKSRLGTLDATNTSLESLTMLDDADLSTLLAPYNRLVSLRNVTVTSRLRTLDLSYNQIKDWSELKPLRALRTLSASGNNATKFLQGNWSAIATKLRFVNFSHNAFQNVSGMSWPASLQHLDLRGNPIEFIDISSDDLPIFQSLQSFFAPAMLSTSACEGRGGVAEQVAGNVTVCVVSDGSAGAFAGGLIIKPSKPSIEASHRVQPSTESSAATIYWSIWSVFMVSMGVIATMLFVRHRRQRLASGDRDRVSSLSTDLESLHSNPVSEALAKLRSEPTLVSFQINATDAKQMRLIDENKTTRIALVRVGESVMVRAQIREKVALQDEAFVLQFLKEIQIRAPLEHARLVQLRGFTCTSTLDLAVYNEYMENGSLGALLKLHGARSDHHDAFPWYARIVVDGINRLDFAIDVAEALVYLHSFDPAVIHGDVRAKNVLIDGAWRAKLAGIRGNPLQRREFKKAPRGAVAWLAPELLGDKEDDASGSTATDVYAFGVFLAELDACGAQPFGHLLDGAVSRSNAQLASEIVKNELKPLFHPQCPSEIRTIAKACLETDPEKRPTSMKLFYDLSQLRKRLARESESDAKTEGVVAV